MRKFPVVCEKNSKMSGKRRGNANTQILAKTERLSNGRRNKNAVRTNKTGNPVFSRKAGPYRISAEIRSTK